MAVLYVDHGQGGQAGSQQSHTLAVHPPAQKVDQEHRANVRQS